MRFLSLLVIVNLSCSLPKTADSPFNIAESSQGVTLYENGQPVFCYQRQPKSSKGMYVLNNYIHPLFDLKGDTLTEEFPEDHPYHRGIFWAWHQLYINDKSIGDGWVMENISMDVMDVKTTMHGSEAQLTTHVSWKSDVYESGKPFIEERTSIIVHQLQLDVRKIDFEISLKALVPGVQLGGSDDIKGYGGFCTRIKLPKGLSFISSDGAVAPQEGQVVAGAWMDFSYYDSAHQDESGLAILCHPSTPNYPAPWILRQSGSMQNIVYPGAERMDTPTILRYRLIIHKGNAVKVGIAALQTEYEKQIVKE
jgi:hypothetical protein